MGTPPPKKGTLILGNPKIELRYNPYYGDPPPPPKKGTLILGNPQIELRWEVWGSGGLVQTWLGLPNNGGSPSLPGDFPKLEVPNCEVPIIRTIVYQSLYWGTPTLGNYH